MASVPAIGIHLGLASSIMAVYRNGKSQVIPNIEGQSLTPSALCYDSDYSEVYVGNAAKEKSMYMGDYLFGLKQIIGRKYYDIHVQKFQHVIGNSFRIVRGVDEKAEIELRHDGLRVRKSPEEACSELLKYLRQCANKYLGTEVSEAVISVPALFNDAQKEATKTAAELAGLNVQKLITEPVAAGIYYTTEHTKHKFKTNTKFLVLNFGRKSSSVSLIEVNDGRLELKIVEEDPFLGGQSFDEILVQHFKSDIDAKISESEIDRLETTERIRNVCIRLKHWLSTENKYSEVLSFRNKEYNMVMSRTEFENLSKPLFTRSLNLVKKIINKAGLKTDITEVVLIGGTLRIPKLCEMISSYLNTKILTTDLNLKESIAFGAAIQAALLKEKNIDLESSIITYNDWLSVDIGFENGRTKVLVKRNPTDHKFGQANSYLISENKKTDMFTLCEGEHTNCIYDNLLNCYEIHNIPDGKAGEIKFEESFSLSKNGFDDEEADKNKYKLILSIEKYAPGENQLKNNLQENTRNAKEEAMFEIFTICKWKIRKICNRILNNLNNIPDEIERTFIDQKCKQLKSILGNLDYTKIDVLRAEYQQFKRVVQTIIDDYIIEAKLKDDTIIFDLIIDEVNEFDSNCQFSVNTTSITYAAPPVEQ